MKYLEEYRDPNSINILLDKIRHITTRPHTLMEVCGGQTHSIIKYGLDQLLPEAINLIHGPGCPVCVTPLEMIEKAHKLSSQDNVIFCSFGDMLRVPGVSKDLLQLKGEGADVRAVYSPLDAVVIAEQNPDKEVVFFAVGFETTAPVNAAAVLQAKAKQLRNFSMLVSHVLVPPAIEAILSSAACSVDGFLAAGHVCTIMGYQDYYPLAEKYRVPIVITGFEPVDLLHGVLLCVEQLENNLATVINQYTRSVKAEGNRSALDMINEVFTVTDRQWRGIGDIANSGLRLRDSYRHYDAEYRFDLGGLTVEEPKACISGKILSGLKKPNQCPAFGVSCTPETPLGAPMVSSEGACAAYYLYKDNGARYHPAQVIPPLIVQENK